MKKIYISGKITGLTPFAYGLRFGYVSTKLRSEGYKVLNPASLLNEADDAGFNHDDLMHICKSMIDVCDAVFMLSNWYQSEGAKIEHQYALDAGKEVIYQKQEAAHENKAI